jgi:hypothetical protein
LHKKIAFCVLLLVLLVTIQILPIVEARPSSENARTKIEQGFRKYLKSLGIRESEIDERTANQLFIKFLDKNKEYLEDLKEYELITRSKKEPKKIPDFSRATVKLGKKIDVFNVSEYRVEINEAFVDYNGEEMSVYKVTFYGSEVPDPWILVHIDYLRVWILWWCITYGEDQWFYTHYTTNANGINEAALFKARVEEWAIGSTALSGILGIILAYFTSGLGAIVGVVGTYNAAWAKHVIDSAYDASRGIQICFFNRYLYTQAGSVIALWAWWWSDSSWHNGLEWAYLGVSMLVSLAISNSLHGIGDKYGYDKWIWTGVYR